MPLTPKTFLLICATFAVLSSQGWSLEKILQARHPLDGTLYQQRGNEACVRFYWRFNSGEPRKLQLEISPSRAFREIIKREVLVNPPYFWCHNAVGRFYWRLILLDDDGQPQEITEIRYVTISPAALTALAPRGGESFDLAAQKAIEFSWNVSDLGKNPLFYRFKIAHDRTFDHPVVNQDIEGTSATLPSLPAGTYYWKVGVKYTPYIPLAYTEPIAFTVTGSPSAPAEAITVQAAKARGVSEATKQPAAKAQAVNALEKTPRSPAAFAAAPAISSSPPAPPEKRVSAPVPALRTNVMAAHPSIHEPDALSSRPQGSTAAKASTAAVQQAQPSGAALSPVPPSVPLVLARVPAPVASPAAGASHVTPAGQVPTQPLVLNHAGGGAAASRPAKGEGAKTTSRGSPALEATQPRDARLFPQEDGEACVHFSWQVGNAEPQRTRLQISPSRCFKKVIKTATIENPPYIWCSKAIGRYYWRLSLLDAGGQPFVTTPIRYVVLAPSGITLNGPGAGSEAIATAGQKTSFAWDLTGFKQKPVFYRFKLAPERNFDKPLVSQDIDGKQIEFYSLQPGVYFWKVGVKYTPYIPIQYSNVMRFEVRRPPPADQILTEQKLAAPSSLASPAPQPIPAQTATSKAQDNVYDAGDIEILPIDEPLRDQQSAPPVVQTPAAAAKWGVLPPLEPSESKAPLPPLDHAVESNRVSDLLPDSGGAGVVSAADDGEQSLESAVQEPSSNAPKPAAPKLASAEVVTSVEAIEAPRLVAPDNHKNMPTLRDIELVTLQWSAPVGARFYLVEVANNRDFANSQRFRTADTLLGIQKPPGDVFWRVKALGQNQAESDYTPPWSFVVNKIPVIVEQAEPGDGAVYKYTKRLPLIRFAWQSNAERISGASYVLKIASSPDLQRPVVESDLKENVRPVDILSAGDYYWQVGVRAAPDAAPKFSAVRRLSVVAEKTQLAVPVPDAPAPGVKIEAAGAMQPVILTWRAGEDAKSFLVEIAENEAFAGAQTFAVFAPELVTARPKGTTYWRVKALDGNAEESLFSSPSRFDVISSARAINASSPASDQTLAGFRVNFRWFAFEGCSSYEVVVSPNKTLNNPIAVEKTSALELAVGFDDEDTYYWCVKCHPTGDSTVQSPIRLFHIKAAH